MNYKLLELKAFDPDLGSNGQVKYEIVSISSSSGSGNIDQSLKNAFYVDRETGILWLKKPLKLKENQEKNSWQISVRALDESLSASAPRQSSIALVNIRVNDVNNNEPQISLSFFQMANLIEPRWLTRKHVPENILNKEELVYLANNLPNRTVIGLVTINDPDAEANGQIENCDLTITNEQV